MGSLKNTVLRLGGLSIAAGDIVVTGRIGVILGSVLIVLAFTLIAVLALTGTFGTDSRRQDAQAVLAILLGRTWPLEAVSPPSNPVSQSGTRQAGSSSSLHPGP
jgi:hypothetical protein